MQKNKTIIKTLIMFMVIVTFNITTKAQTSTIDTTKLSATNFSISKSNGSNQKLRIYNSMIDIDNFTIVDYGLNVYTTSFQFFACPPITNTSPKSIVEIDFSNLSIGVYYIKSTLAGNEVFYKVSIIN